ncbi:MAG: DNA-directed RNA polymerase subunit omega [Crocinitomicaceae bacterium]|jgi:DNA-directed RNA polymerase subunit K/omega|nr:DNA-directed RNA polymerase subunit omega [Crocinitomicaceae bacterium]
MNFKNTNSERSTITRDTINFEEKTGNVYEAIVAMSKRSNQISSELKEELTSKLQEFASSTDNLEEVFENREQIEISKYYEKLPKPVAIAMTEMLEDKIYVRKIEEETK